MRARSHPCLLMEEREQPAGWHAKQLSFRYGIGWIFVDPLANMAFPPLRFLAHPLVLHVDQFLTKLLGGKPRDIGEGLHYCEHHRWCGSKKLGKVLQTEKCIRAAVQELSNDPWEQERASSPR